MDEYRKLYNDLSDEYRQVLKMYNEAKAEVERLTAENEKLKGQTKRLIDKEWEEAH